MQQIVDDIAATLQVRRGHLNVVAASKGLFAGAIKVHTSDGVVLEGGSQVSLNAEVLTLANERKSRAH